MTLYSAWIDVLKVPLRPTLAIIMIYFNSTNRYNVLRVNIANYYTVQYY